MAVTIEDIARRAGVSPGTVSRVLNGLNKENRPAIARRSAKIREIAKELNYRPNHAARQMLKGRFDSVGFLSCGDLGFDWFPRQLLHGIHDALKARGSRLVITEIAGENFTDPSYIPSFVQETTVDGLLVHPESVEIMPVTAFFDGDPLPAVYVNCRLEQHAVYPDDHADAYGATVRLIEAGHKAIGFWGPPNQGGTTHFSIVDRLSGFEDAMHEHGLAAHRVGFQAEPISELAAGCASPEASAFFEMHPGMTATLCYDLPQATQLYVAARARGLRPPYDCCLVVFYETPFHMTTGIPMATSVIPFFDVGQKAVEMVAQIIDGVEGSTDSVAVRSKRFFDEGLIVPPAGL